MPKLNDAEIQAALTGLAGWQRAGEAIEKTYRFANYYETVAFVNAVAWVAHGTNHHPDLVVGYNRCTVRYSTHDVGGLSEKDVECARRVEALTQGKG